MTSDEESRLWQAEMTANRARYARWLKREGRAHRQPHDSPAIARARDLVRQAHELVATSISLRRRNR